VVYVNRMVVNAKALPGIVVNVLLLLNPMINNYVTEMRRLDDTAVQSISAVDLV